MHRDRSVGGDGLLRIQTRLDQRRDGLLDLLQGSAYRAAAELSANENEVAEDRIAPEVESHRSRVIAKGLTPIGCVDGRDRELELFESAIGHRVEQVVFASEIPVDACDADVKVLGEYRHAQIVDRHLRGDFESAVEDFVGVDRPTVPTLAGVRPRGFSH